MAGRILWKLATLQYRQKNTYRTLLWGLTRAWREIPNAPIDRYPAHVHVNVAAGYRWGIGKKLFDAVLLHLRRNGIRGLHAILVESEGHDRMTRIGQKVYRCQVTAMRRCSLAQKLTHRESYVKVVVMDLTEPRAQPQKDVV